MHSRDSVRPVSDVGNDIETSSLFQTYNQRLGKLERSHNIVCSARLLRLSRHRHKKTKFTILQKEKQGKEHQENKQHSTSTQLSNINLQQLPLSNSTHEATAMSESDTIGRDGQPRSGPDRDRPRPTDLRPSRTEPIPLVRSGPSVSPGPIGSVQTQAQTEDRPIWTDIQVICIKDGM